MYVRTLELTVSPLPGAIPGDKNHRQQRKGWAIHMDDICTGYMEGLTVLLHLCVANRNTVTMSAGSRDTHTCWLRLAASRCQTWCSGRAVLSQPYRYTKAKAFTNYFSVSDMTVLVSQSLVLC